MERLNVYSLQTFAPKSTHYRDLDMLGCLENVYGKIKLAEVLSHNSERFH